MASLNKVLLIGNLGRDPEMRSTSDGNAVATFSIATSESWKDKTSGQKQEKTEWHNIVMYRRLAEIAGQYLRKGSSVYLEGRLQTRKWQDKEGRDRYTTEIVADEMKMLGSRGGGQGSAEYDQTPAYEGGGAAPARPAARAPAAVGATPPAPAGNFDDFEDDVPF